MAGTGGHLEAYAHNIAAFAQRYRVIAYDYPGHGYTTQATADLEGKLRQIIGPVAIKGLAGDGKSFIDTLLEGDEDFARLDGLFATNADESLTVVVTTPRLFDIWMRTHEDFWKENPLKAWLGKLIPTTLLPWVPNWPVESCGRPVFHTVRVKPTRAEFTIAGEKM